MKYVFTLLMLSISLGMFAQKTEALSQKGKILIVGENIDFNAYIKRYVEDNIAVWQRKGEFETTEGYKNRITEENRQKKVDELVIVAIDELKKIYSKLIDYSKFELGKYDADNQTYLISHPKLGQITMPVDLNSAPSLKQDFDQVVFTNIDFAIANNKLNLSKLTIKDPVNNKQFQFNSEADVKYVTQDIEYSFAPIDLDLPEQKNNYTNNSRIENESFNVGSDPVDVNIPKGKIKRINTFAVIIGNEKYNNEREVPFARNDATVFKNYIVETLGLPNENVHLIANATLGQILGEIKWITDVAKAYVGNASIIFYYAGHGMPDDATKDAYLLPIDGMSEMTQTAIKLDWLYKELNKYPTKQTLVFLDACFSGASRDGMLAEGRGVKIKPKENSITGNMIIMSAATGEETAYPLNENGHGLFTYYLLKKIQETNGNVNLGSLSDYIIKNVSQKSVVKNGKPQNPKVNVSIDIQNTWRNIIIGN